MKLKIALVFNNEREDTTGGYFLRCLNKTRHTIDHYWTRDAAAIKPGYDLYLRIDHGDYKYDLPLKLRPQVFLAIDTHFRRPFKKIVKQARHYDLVFCVHKDSIRPLRRRGIKAEWLPVACDPQIHQKRDLPKTYDIAFVGTSGKKHMRGILLKQLARRYPQSFLDKAPFREMSRIYSSAKIGFNYSINNDVNMRIFEVMSCGAMLLTNRIRGNGFAELFEDGRHLVSYRSARQLFRLIDYYLEHDQEREQIAQNGYQLVTRQHTYERRLVQMLDCIKIRLAGRYPQLAKL